MNQGDCILVEANEHHSMKNVSESPVHYLVFGISRNQNGKTINVE
jgi:mannose-6-phosphate isomerase-like protein (cupin superfamily)